MIRTKTFVQKILFDGNRATGVACTQGGKALEYRANREIILSAGAIQSPQLLQLSGIGAKDHLRGLGISVICDSSGVGQNLQEHWMAIVQHKLKKPVSFNFDFSGLRLLKHVLRYSLFKTGLMSSSSHEICLFIKTRPELDRPDAQIVFAPFSVEPIIGDEAKFAFEPWHGIHIHGFQQRPESRGSIMIQSTDPAVQPAIKMHHFSEELDCRTIVDTVRYIRKLAENSALKEFIETETTPGVEVQTDDEILAAAKRAGGSVYHACGTCKMGQDDLAVVDSRLRVHGINGLRVADASVMPTLVSGNTNAAAMMIGWRASDLILEDVS